MREPEMMPTAQFRPSISSLPPPPKKQRRWGRHKASAPAPPAFQITHMPDRPHDDGGVRALPSEEECRALLLAMHRRHNVHWDDDDDDDDDDLRSDGGGRVSPTPEPAAAAAGRVPTIIVDARRGWPTRARSYSPSPSVGVASKVSTRLLLPRLIQLPSPPPSTPLPQLPQQRQRLRPRQPQAKPPLAYMPTLQTSLAGVRKLEVEKTATITPRSVFPDAGIVQMQTASKAETDKEQVVEAGQEAAGWSCRLCRDPGSPSFQYRGLCPACEQEFAVPHEIFASRQASVASGRQSSRPSSWGGPGSGTRPSPAWPQPVLSEQKNRVMADGGVDDDWLSSNDDKPGDDGLTVRVERDWLGEWADGTLEDGQGGQHGWAAATEASAQSRLRDLDVFFGL